MNYDYNIEHLDVYILKGGNGVRKYWAVLLGALSVALVVSGCLNFGNSKDETPTPTPMTSPSPTATISPSPSPTPPSDAPDEKLKQQAIAETEELMLKTKMLDDFKVAYSIEIDNETLFSNLASPLFVTIYKKDGNLRAALASVIYVIDGFIIKTDNTVTSYSCKGSYGEFNCEEDLTVPELETDPVRPIYSVSSPKMFKEFELKPLGEKTISGHKCKAFEFVTTGREVRDFDIKQATEGGGNAGPIIMLLFNDLTIAARDNYDFNVKVEYCLSVDKGILVYERINAYRGSEKDKNKFYGAAYVLKEFTQGIDESVFVLPTEPKINKPDTMAEKLVKEAKDELLISKESPNKVSFATNYVLSAGAIAPRVGLDEEQICLSSGDSESIRANSDGSSVTNISEHWVSAYLSVVCAKAGPDMLERIKTKHSNIGELFKDINCKCFTEQYADKTCCLMVVER
jgi:hypothetical protein